MHILSIALHTATILISAIATTMLLSVYVTDEEIPYKNLLFCVVIEHWFLVFLIKNGIYTRLSCWKSLTMIYWLAFIVYGRDFSKISMTCIFPIKRSNFWKNIRGHTNFWTMLTWMVLETDTSLQYCMYLWILFNFEDKLLSVWHLHIIPIENHPIKLVLEQQTSKHQCHKLSI